MCEVFWYKMGFFLSKGSFSGIKRGFFCYVGMLFGTKWVFCFVHRRFFLVQIR